MTPPPFRRALAAGAMALLIGAAPLATHAQTQAQAQAQAPLRIGVEAGYPPFSSLAPDGKVVGFDIDIATAICASLKTACTFVQTEFDAMIPALRAKKLDAIVASMSATAERRKAVDFSDMYYESVARFVGRTDGTFEITPAGLKGRKIGVQRATIHERFVIATFPATQIVRYAKQDEVFLDLMAGRIDGTVVDNIAASEGFLKTPSGKGYAFRGPSWNDPKFFGDGPGIAVRKGETALLGRINNGLATILADGTYRKIQSKYFDFDVAPPKKK